MDPLDAVLGSLRLETALLSRARFGSPWAVETTGAAMPILHAVVEGRCLLRHGEREVSLEEGDVVILPHGPAHVMASGPQVSPVRVREVTRPGPDGVGRVDHGGPGAGCRIICGTFRLHHQAGAWLVDRLPPQLHLRPAGDASDWLEGTLRLLDRELERAERGAVAVVTRLTDLLLLQALRHHAVHDPEPVRGWLIALRDEQIGRALALIHGQPDEAWAVPELALRVGMSRSRFYDRFVNLVGEPPARYLARWRVSAAADLMQRRALSVAEAAALVGYGSEQSLANAFRRHFGMSPSQLRRRWALSESTAATAAIKVD